MRNGRPRAADGWAYLFLLVAVAVVAGAAAGAVQVGSTIARRQAEQQLIDIGLQFAQALQRYAAMSPAGHPTAPRDLDQLLADDRFPGTVRHLRRVYDDPLTGVPAWGLVRDGEGLIVGVHSLSPQAPIMEAGFPEALAGLEGAASYQEWVFRAPQPPGVPMPLAVSAPAVP